MASCTWVETLSDMTIALSYFRWVLHLLYINRSDEVCYLWRRYILKEHNAPLCCVSRRALLRAAAVFVVLYEMMLVRVVTLVAGYSMKIDEQLQWEC